MHPPPADEDLLREILDQVLPLLAQLRPEVVGEALLASLEDALEGPEPGRPSMQLLQGGRSECAERASAPPPLLGIAEEPPWQEEARPDGPLHIQVLEPAEQLPEPGRIALEPGEQRIICSAIRPRAYRIHCDAGTIGIHGDAQPVHSLRTGQSLDIEAQCIQAQALGEQAGLGRYIRLGDVEPSGSAGQGS